MRATWCGEALSLTLTLTLTLNLTLTWCGKVLSPTPHPNPNLVWQGAQPDGGEAQPCQLPPRAESEQRAQRAGQLGRAPHREAGGDVRRAIELEAAW